MKEKLILRNKTEIELESGSSLADMRIKFLSWGNMAKTIELFTEQNLSAVSIKNGDGIVVGIYENLVFYGESSIPQSDGTILTSISLRKKTEIEKRLDVLEKGQEVHTGAIEDLGAAVSGLAEEGGLS